MNSVAVITIKPLSLDADTAYAAWPSMRGCTCVSLKTIEREKSCVVLPTTTIIQSIDTDLPARYYQHRLPLVHCHLSARLGSADCALPESAHPGIRSVHITASDMGAQTCQDHDKPPPPLAALPLHALIRHIAPLILRMQYAFCHRSGPLRMDAFLTTVLATETVVIDRMVGFTASFETFRNPSAGMEQYSSLSVVDFTTGLHISHASSWSQLLFLAAVHGRRSKKKKSNYVMLLSTLVSGS